MQSTQHPDNGRPGCAIGRYMLLFLMCLCMAGTVAFADHRDDDDDDDRDIDQAIVGDTAVLLEEGEFEIMLSASFEEEDDLETVELIVEMEYGLTDWLELGIEVPYLFLMPTPDDEHDVDGLSDVTLSVSVPLPAEPPFLAAASLAVGLPTGNDKRSEDLGDGYVLWEPSVMVDVALGAAELVFDIGGEFADDVKVFNCDVTLAYPVGEVVPSIGVECSIDRSEEEVLLVPGIGFPIAEDVELGIEAPIGLTTDSPNWGIVVELTFEF